MNESLVYTLIALCCLAILGLSFVIYRQIRASKQRISEQKAKEEAYAAGVAEQKRYLVESIKLISNAILHDDKITMTEGCMRLKVMIDNLDPTLHQVPELDVIEEVYQRTSHIPILADWKALDRKEQRQYEKLIATTDAECFDRIQKAAKYLFEHPMHKVH